MAGKRIVFGEDAARRIAAAVKRVEAAPVLPGREAPGVRGAWNPGTLDAVVTTAIPAGTATTYSTTGRAQIKVDDDSGGIINDPSYPDPVVVLGFFTNMGTVAVGTKIQVKWRNGKFSYAGGDC